MLGHVSSPSIFPNTISIHASAVGYQSQALWQLVRSAAAMDQNDYYLGHGTTYLAEPSDQQAPSIIVEDAQPEIQQGFSYAPEPYIHSPVQKVSPAHQQHGITSVVPSQTLPHEAAYNIEHIHMLPTSPQGPHERVVYNRDLP